MQNVLISAGVGGKWTGEKAHSPETGVTWHRRGVAIASSQPACLQNHNSYIPFGRWIKEVTLWTPQCGVSAPTVDATSFKEKRCFRPRLLVPVLERKAAFCQLLEVIFFYMQQC